MVCPEVSVLSGLAQASSITRTTSKWPSLAVEHRTHHCHCIYLGCI
jgi:hypothetical protein